MFKPSTSKRTKVSGWFRAGTLRNAEGGECFGVKRGQCGETKYPLSAFIREPMLTKRLSQESKDVLLRECLYRLRVVQRAEIERQLAAEKQNHEQEA